MGNSQSSDVSSTRNSRNPRIVSQAPSEKSKSASSDSEKPERQPSIANNISISVPGKPHTVYQEHSEKSKSRSSGSEKLEGQSNANLSSNADAGKPQVASQVIPEDFENAAEAAVRHLTFWRDGFQFEKRNAAGNTIGCSKLYRFEDPESTSILRQINLGSCPPRIIGVREGQPLKVHVAKMFSEKSPLPGVTYDWLEDLQEINQQVELRRFQSQKDSEMKKGSEEEEEVDDIRKDLVAALKSNDNNQLDVVETVPIRPVSGVLDEREVHWLDGHRNTSL